MNRISKRLLGWAGGAAALALVAGAPGAQADPIVLAPGTPGAGLDAAAITPFDAQAGGDGTINQRIQFSCDGSAGACASTFSTAGIVDITSFTGYTNAATGIGVGWQLFGVFTMTGSGNWSGGTGNNFLATSDTMNLQIWGVQGIGALGLSNPTSATALLADLESQACASNTCIELAHGTSTGDSFAINGSTNGQRNEVFTLSTLLTGDDASFFDPVPISVTLSILSGPSDNANNSDIIGNIDTDKSRGNGKEWVTCSPASGGSRLGPVGVCPGTGNVTWDINGTDPTTQVPEPATLVLLGSALVGFGILRRSRRRDDA